MPEPYDSNENDRGNNYFFRAVDAGNTIHLPEEHAGDIACLIDIGGSAKVLGYPTVGEDGTITLPSFVVPQGDAVQAVIPNDQEFDRDTLPEWEASGGL